METALYGCIAQLARAFGSYPKCHRFKSSYSHHRPVGQAAKTPPFHGGNMSSILVRVTKTVLLLQNGFFFNYILGGALYYDEIY